MILELIGLWDNNWLCYVVLCLFQSGVQNMLQFYIPEVTGVEEVLDEVDLASQKAFEDLEHRIMTKKPTQKYN